MTNAYVAVIGEEGYKDKYKAAKAIREFTGKYAELTRSRWYSAREPFAVIWDGWRTMWIGSYNDFLRFCNTSDYNVIMVSKNVSFIGAIK